MNIEVVFLPCVLLDNTLICRQSISLTAVISNWQELLFAFRRFNYRQQSGDEHHPPFFTEAAFSGTRLFLIACEGIR
ncbi:MAG: hypothetical protein MUO63_19580 [Desulfobulbaceae bacterium]|nr:hypothetical protein [Desulfobulbaceae bacterium]